MFIKPSQTFSRVGPPALPAPAKNKNPGLADRFELQEQVTDATRELGRLGARATRGRVLSVAGAGTLIASLGLAATQGLGSRASTAIAITLGLSATVGIGLIAAGLHEASAAGFLQSEAREEIRHLRSLYERRLATGV